MNFRSYNRVSVRISPFAACRYATQRCDRAAVWIRELRLPFRGKYVHVEFICLRFGNGGIPNHFCRRCGREVGGFREKRYLNARGNIEIQKTKHLYLVHLSPANKSKGLTVSILPRYGTQISPVFSEGQMQLHFPERN